MLFVKVIFTFCLAIFAVSALVPLLGVGVLVPELTEKIFVALEAFASSVEDKLLGRGAKKAAPDVNFSFKDFDSYIRLTRKVFYHIFHIFMLGVWFLLQGLVFLFVTVPNELGKFGAKFVTLRSILTTKPLDDDDVDRADAPLLEREKLTVEAGDDKED